MISWIANVIGGLEGLSYLLTAVVGVGCLGYVAVTWVIHLVNSGQQFVYLLPCGCSSALRQFWALYF